MSPKSEFYRRYFQCIRKVEFSYQEARQRLKNLRGDNPFVLQDLNVYECPWCHKFHLGHGKPPKPFNFPEGWEQLA